MNEATKAFRQYVVQKVNDTANITISLPIDYIRAFKDCNKAAVFSNLLFWSSHSVRKDGYVYKSDRELAEAIGITPPMVRRARTYLVKEGLFDVTVKRANGAPTNHYSPNYDKIFLFFLNNDATNHDVIRQLVIAQKRLDEGEAPVNAEEAHPAPSEEELGEVVY